MWRSTQYPYLLHNKPDELRGILRDAFHKHRGSVTDAADELGVSLRRWYHYAEALGQMGELQEIRQLYRQADPPKTRTRNRVVYSDKPTRTKAKPSIEKVEAKPPAPKRREKVAPSPAPKENTGTDEAEARLAAFLDRTRVV
jgi:hypothetical protein